MATFVVFLIWTLAFYLILFILAYKGRPGESVIAVAFSRIRTEAPHNEGASTTAPSRPMSLAGPDPVALTEPRSPYLHHQPPFRATRTPTHDEDFSPGSPRQVDTEDEIDDEDEDTQQRRMEDEMGRRDVSIVTVPRRKLWITNPSSS